MDSSYLATPDVSPLAMVMYLAIIIMSIVSHWILFNKAGEPGWACLVPIYNIIVFFRIAGKPWYYIFALIIPILNLVILITALQGFLKAFGRGGFGSVVLAIFLGTIYFPYLAFSSDVEYVGV